MFGRVLLRRTKLAPDRLEFVDAVPTSAITPETPHFPRSPGAGACRFKLLDADVRNGCAP